MKKIYIIAEVGVNHNGDVNIALELIDRAKEIGVDCVKFQTFKAENIVTQKSPKANYQLNVTDATESQFDMLKKLELKQADYHKLIERCKLNKIDFLSTPYNFEDVDFLDNLNVNAFKIASGQLTEIPFLKYAAKKSKQMIISTGMGTLSDVFNAVQAIKESGNENIVVLQCTTNYPSKIQDANILAMNSIKDSCKVRVGYSDHVENNYACFAAAAMGAEIIEKHFTLDRNMEGPDHSSSLEPNEFKQLIHGIREIELALGNGIKIPTYSEKENEKGMKRSLVANREIVKGEKLQLQDIGFKRPFDGISPNLLDSIIGKEVTKNISKDESFKMDSIKW